MTETALLRVSPHRPYTIVDGRVIGVCGLLDGENHLYSPAKVVGEADAMRAMASNRRDCEGFVLRRDGGGPLIATFYGSAPPRRYERRAFVVHNIEVGNYGSFLIRELPQLLAARRHALDFDLYVVSARTPWLLDAIRLLDLPARPVYETGEVCGDVFAEIQAFDSFDHEGFLDPETLRGINGLKEKAGAPAADSPTDLYVSRALSRIRAPQYRPLVNEAEIEALVTAEGFAVVHPETLSFAAQIRLFAGARRIVGPSGSGMLNSLFAGAGATVLDMESYHVTVRQHAKVYASSGKDYGFVFGRFITGRDNTQVTSPWVLMQDFTNIFF